MCNMGCWKYCLSAFLMIASYGELMAECDFGAKHIGVPEIATTRLPSLEGLRFTAQDPTNDPAADSYSYSIGICTDAEDGQTADFLKYAGVVQTKIQGSDGVGTKVVIGRYNETEIMAGENWIFLEYEGGKKYHEGHCGSEPRRANIIITCTLDNKDGYARIIEENRQKTSDCYYLFEIEHIAACAMSAPSGLSVGSVIVIIAIVLVAVYLIAGFLVQRFYRGAKGLEQIPNYSFWRDFGNLQADGCAFICRCGEVDTESRQYRGLGDEQLEKELDFTVEDENLLPM